MRTLSEPLKTTFRVLAETANEAAVGVLVPALDSPYGTIRDSALSALLARRSPVGHREVIGRLHRFDRHALSIVQDQPHRMTRALRDAVLSSQRQFCHNGCRAAVWLREYDLVPALLTALEDSSNPNADLATAALSELVELLYRELITSHGQGGGRDPRAVRRRVVSALEGSVGRFGRHKRREVLEAFAVLAKRDNAQLRHVLDDPHHAAFITLVEVLAQSRAAGVIRLLLSFLDDPHAPSVVLSVLAKRTDLTLVRHLLRKVGPEPSSVVRRNLKRISAVGWIGQRVDVLDHLDEQAQQAAVALVMASAIPRQQAFAAIKHILLRGKPAGRRAAAQALEEFQGAAANDLALRALGDTDPEVQANVLVQLRRRGIPGALSQLIDRLDSPHEAVRAAIRESLEEFTFHRYVAAFDMLDEEIRRSTGLLVKRIDPETLPLLKQELNSRLRTRRLRALSIVQAIDAVDALEDEIIARLEDEDHMVRVRAAEALGRGTGPAGYEALLRATEDRAVVVREAVQAALERRERPAAAGGAASAAGREDER